MLPVTNGTLGMKFYKMENMKRMDKNFFKIAMRNRETKGIIPQKGMEGS